MDDRKQKRQRSIFTHAFATVHSESFSSGHICILQKGCTNRNSHFQESPSKESKHYCPLPMLFSQTAFITPFFLSTNEYNVRGRLEVSGCTCTLQSGFRPQHQEKKKKKNCSTSIYLLPNQDKENISNLLQSPILPLLKARRHPKLSSCFRC